MRWWGDIEGTMGRLSQFYWFLNLEELPGRIERDGIFTSLNVETDALKKIRRDYRTGLRKVRKEEEKEQMSFLDGDTPDEGY
jgi:hypothetical protein